MSDKPRVSTLDNVLSRVFRERNWQNRLGVNRIFLFWNDLVGDELADIAQPDVVRGDVLWLNVVDSCWMQQLHFQKPGLLEAINRRLRKDCGLGGDSAIPQIKDLRFAIASTTLTQQKDEPGHEVKEAPVDPLREANFDILIKSIKDKELRARMKRVWRSQEKRLD